MKNRLALLLPIFLITIHLPAALNAQITIKIDSKINHDPLDLKILQSKIVEFNCSNPVEGFETWGNHWMSGHKVIFYNKPAYDSEETGYGKENEVHRFAMMDLDRPDEVIRFDIAAPYQRARMIHFIDETSSVMVLFDRGLIANYHQQTQTLETQKLDYNIVSSEDRGNNKIIIYGLSLNDNEEIPCFIQMSYDGKVIRYNLEKRFSRTRCSANESESVFLYKNELYWFNLSDYSLYKISSDLRVKKEYTITLPEAVTFEELSNPFKFSTLLMNQFPNRSYMNNEIGIVHNYFVLCFIHNKDQYYSVTNMDNFSSMTVKKNYTFQDINKRTMLPLRISSHGQISMELTPSNIDNLLPNNLKNKTLTGPSLLYLQ